VGGAGGGVNGKEVVKSGRHKPGDFKIGTCIWSQQTCLRKVKHKPVGGVHDAKEVVKGATSEAISRLVPGQRNKKQV
jgi:hypothetical protein